jgi:hypothetical protein
LTEAPSRIVGGKIMPAPTGRERDPHDPPIFLLVASPSWAPWLPDSAFQRVPIGGTGQVLTVQADGSVNWQNSAAGFSNPMTTVGDIIIEGAGPAPTRLAIGTAGQVLTVASGLPSWQNSAAGFTNPMTTAGDLITAAGGGAPLRLPAGAANQVLTIVSGAPTWSNSSAGFTNPMTSTGDIIVGGLAGAAARLGAGANGQVLTLVSGTPQWVAGSTSATAVVFPSGDSTGVTDQTNITNTWTSGLVANGGEVLLAAGTFTVKPPSGLKALIPPAQTTAGTAGGNPVCIRGLGASTVLQGKGAGTIVIYYHRTSGYGAQFNQAAQKTVGYIHNLVIDGTNTTGAAIGLDCGDGWGGDINGVRVANFDTAGAIGIRFAQDQFWCEKWRFWVELLNNTTQFYQTTAIPGMDHSHEYNYYDVNMFCNQNQNGVVIDGVNMGGSQLFLRGNMCQTTATSGAPTGNVAALSIVNTTGANNGESRWYDGEIWYKVEFNNTPQFPTGSVAPYCLYMDGVARGIQQCTGFITNSNLTNSAINGAEFSFYGPISGDPNLAQAFPGAPGSQSTLAPGTNPAVPATGTAQQNYGPNAQVFVTGGTVSGVSINGVPTGTTGGSYFVAAGGTITLNYTVAPTWTWVPAAQMSF